MISINAVLWEALGIPMVNRRSENSVLLKCLLFDCWREIKN